MVALTNSFSFGTYPKIDRRTFCEPRFRRSPGPKTTRKTGSGQSSDKRFYTVRTLRQLELGGEAPMLPKLLRSMALRTMLVAFVLLACRFWLIVGTQNAAAQSSATRVSMRLRN